MAGIVNKTDLFTDSLTDGVPIDLNTTSLPLLPTRRAPPRTTFGRTRGSSTTTPLNELSFNFMDTPEFQDRMSDMLSGREGRGSTPGPRTTPRSRAEEEGVINMGILIPVAVFVLFLLTVSCCFLWQAFHERRRNRRKKIAVPQSFYRSYSGWDDYRSSVRSTAKLKLPPPSYSHREFTPQLDRISESPEDQLADNYTTKNENLFSPTSSMASVLSRLHYELPSISQHVQYPCPPPSYVADLSQSYPNLRVAPQPPFSPYHLTWMTPTAHRPVRSEPNIRLSTDLSRVLSTAGQLPSTPSEIGIPVNQRAWKSPYHPNYNTPTNGSDHDSGALPPHTVLNHTHSLSTAPGSSTIGSAFSSSDPVLALSTELPTHYNGAHGGRVLAGCESCASRTRVGLLEADVRLSAQANVRSWQYNQLYVQPGDSSFPPPLNPVGLGGLPDKAALEQHVAYGNCSMCAFMGSSDTSAIHAFSGNAMGPELPDLIGNSRSALPPYTQMDHQFLRLYDPGIASAPPYYVTVPPYESTKHRIAYNSGNTSMDAHRDTESLETSAATSTITGQASSRHSSGSTGGPSHSTSLTGLLSGRQSILAWPSRNTSASSSAFPGLSSLTPVLSGQTTNTPETSVSADSTSTTTHGQNTSDETHDSSNKSKTIPDENNNSDVMGLVDDRSLNTTKSSKTPGELSRSEERNGVTFARTWYDSSSQDQSSGTVGHTPTHKSHQTSTSGSGSFQWDSMRVSASFGDTLSSDQESFILGGPGSPKPKDTITGPRSSQPNTRGFEWDGYPFYTPEELRSRAESTDSGATIPRLINAHPVLANTQYWV